MCGIFCSLSTSGHLTPSASLLDRLKCRGPDSENTIRVQTSSSSPAITLCSTVLSLRGDHVTTQPYKDETSAYILCWNGEAWSIDNQSGIQDDTATVYALLRESLEEGTQCDGHQSLNSVTKALSRVAGPYAFVLIDDRRRHLYFGRDFLGRRSLCWTRTAEDIILCSVPDAIPGHEWHEAEADGVYFVDLNSLPTMDDTGNQQSDEDANRPSFAACAPYQFTGDGSSVIPRLSLNKTILVDPQALDANSSAVANLGALLRDSLASRVLNVPDPPRAGRCLADTKIAILFSGGLDCTVLARQCHDLLPERQSIDLLNVAFENPRIHSKLEGGLDAACEACPDRVTGRASFEELQTVCSGRTFRFVAINVPYSDTSQHRDTVVSLMRPHNTEMDLSISYALYFAARGSGVVSDPATGMTSEYTTPARVLLSGLGADELFGGYTRHATAFRRAGFAGLIDELELDVSRLGKRNLGRDDRVISHWGKEVRFPFLDENLVSWAVTATVDEKCGFGEPETGDGTISAVLEPGKKVLRCLAWKLGMEQVAKEKKRAIQFGARTAKMETGKTKGTTLLS